MDNMEEKSRSTEQDRVANPVEETVSTTVETAMSENKKERKKSVFRCAKFEYRNKKYF